MIIPFMECPTCKGSGRAGTLTTPSMSMYCPSCGGRGDLAAALTNEIRNSVLKETSLYLDSILSTLIQKGIWCFVCKAWVSGSVEGSIDYKGWCCRHHTIEEIRESNKMIPDGYCLDKEGHLQELSTNDIRFSGTV